MTVADLIACADLDSRVERLMLADALEEAGRDDEADLLRGDESVCVTAGAVTHWAVEAALRGVARCRLGEWLQMGRPLMRAPHAEKITRVEITDREPRGGGRRWHWGVPSPTRPGGRHRLPWTVFEIIRASAPSGGYAGHESPAAALAELSAACIIWANGG